MDRQPNVFERLAFMFLVANISFFFAEIVSGSSMIMSFDPATILFGLVLSAFITIPLYGLHTIVLAWVVYRFSKPRLYTLFLAGGIFGLYEAYITKVIWTGWSAAPMVSFHGVAVLETAILILFWHPLMAFIVPLFVSESILTRSREILSGLPWPLRKILTTPALPYIGVFAFALLCGINQGSHSPFPLNSMLSDFLAAGILCPMIFAYRYLGLHRFSIRSLLPGKIGFAGLLALLLLMYLVLGRFIRFDQLPGLDAQMVVWLLYVVFFGLLLLSMIKSANTAVPGLRFPKKPLNRVILMFFNVFMMTSSFVSLLPIKQYLMIAFMIVAIVGGCSLLALSTLDFLSLEIWGIVNLAASGLGIIHARLVTRDERPMDEAK